MISLKRNFLFIHVPKTAGNSIQNILRAYSEDRIVCSAAFQDGTERFGVISERYKTHKHSTLSDYRAALGSELIQRLFKFSVVRNPWDRMISCYFSPHRGVVSWDKAKFIQLLAEIQPVTSYFSLQNGGISGIDSFGNINSFIRFEHLDDDFKNICSLIDIPWEPLPVRNKSERQHYARYYDYELVELVRNLFADEIDFFKYEFESTSNEAMPHNMSPFSH